LSHSPSVDLLQELDIYVDAGKEVTLSVFYNLENLIDNEQFHERILLLLNKIVNNNQELHYSLIKKVVAQLKFTPA
jgi:hypothetical protein